MPEFRFEGTAANGKSVQGVITTDSLKIAKKKIVAMATSRHIRINKILQKRNFLYKIQKGSEKPITGLLATRFTHPTIRKREADE